MPGSSGTNVFPAPCIRCGVLVPPLAGELLQYEGGEPYLTCPVCSLAEGVPSPEWIWELLSCFPKKDPYGPGRIAPYPYQAADAVLVARMLRKLIGMEMGTGKTPVTALSIPPGWPTMVFAPASVKYLWTREIERWRSGIEPHLELRPVIAKNKKTWTLPEPGQVLVATYGLLPGDPCAACRQKKLKACTHREDQDNPLPEIDRPMVLVADEIQYLQNRTQRRRKWDLLAERVLAAGGMLRGLTGSVISNKPGDTLEILRCLRLEKVFAMPFSDRQLEYRFQTWFARSLTDEQVAAKVKPGYKDRYKYVFWNWYSQPKGRRRKPEGELHQALLEVLRPVRISRYRRHVLAHLPPVQYEEIPVKLNKRTMDDVRAAVQQMLATRRAHQEIKEGLIEDPWGKQKVFDGKRHKQVKLSPEEKERRRIIFQERVAFYYETRPWVEDIELRDAVKEALESREDSPVFTELAKVRAILSLAKVSVALELVEKHEDAEQPAIFFCQHVAVLEKLFGNREGWSIYQGKVSQKKRDQIVQDFQRGKIRHGIGVSIMAGGEGVTLTRAAHMVFLDMHWNPQKNKQAEARVQRPGAEQHEKIIIRHLIANHPVDRLVKITVDEKNELALALEDVAASKAGLTEAA